MDKKIIFALIDRFNAGGMSALDYSDGEVTLALRKNGPATGALPADGAGKPAGKPPPDTPSPQPSAAPATSSEYITSPIVGVFYGSSEPDAPPFVKAGSRVKAGQILCVIEAMKMMNKLEAEADCEIVSVMAGNGEMVEYGQPLFEVRR
jgi:acetyl-CoA carboxylase biotin carboxyl carrier protein